MTSRLLLADDHPLILDGLVRLFQSESEFEIVAVARRGDETWVLLCQEKPDVAVIDVKMPLLSGIDIARRAAQEKLPTRIVLLTATIHENEVVEAFRSSVRGIILKDTAPQNLLDAVRKVASGGQWIEPNLAGRTLETLLLERKERETAKFKLTQRELEIVRLVARGMKNGDIGRALSIAEGTVKIHLNRVYEKLSVTNRVELTNFANAEHLT